MFKDRLKSGIVLVIVAAVLMYFGGIALFLAVTGISIIGLFELYRAVGFEKSGLAIVSYLLGGAQAVLVYMGLQREHFMFYTLAVLLVLMGVYVFTFPKYDAKQVMTAFFGQFYVVMPLSCIYSLRCLQDGIYLVWLIFICAWGCDTLAYCTGMLFGKHKMTPALSPKKTIEGAVGGVVGTALLGVIFALAFGQVIDSFHNAVLAMAILCAAGGLMSMVGDLAASAIKRNYEIKDYSNLIPGHGGILDRFDSIIVTAPVVYYMVLFLSYYEL